MLVEVGNGAKGMREEAVMKCRVFSHTVDQMHCSCIQHAMEKLVCKV